MVKKVNFNSAVAGAALDLVIFDIEGVQVSAGPFSIKYKNNIDDGSLDVLYSIGGPNGASYKITYSCMSDGETKTDPAKPSPIDGKIQHFGGDTVKLTILL